MLSIFSLELNMPLHLKADVFTEGYQTSQSGRYTHVAFLQGNPDGNLQRARM